MLMTLIEKLCKSIEKDTGKEKMSGPEMLHTTLTVGFSILVVSLLIISLLNR